MHSFSVIPKLQTSKVLRCQWFWEVKRDFLFNGRLREKKGGDEEHFDGIEQIRQLLSISTDGIEQLISNFLENNQCRSFHEPGRRPAMCASHGALDVTGILRGGYVCYFL